MSYSAEMWKAIATGGRWTMDEVREAVPSVQYGRVRTGLWQMARTGSLVKYEDGRYGVAAESVVPMGVTVQEVLQAMGKDA